ncbi:MAG TPA: hypothetical protein VMU85_10505, partial [Stellaceae bacterium]|nr:hypothetical protein [Stellaceae bacterium]
MRRVLRLALFILGGTVAALLLAVAGLYGLAQTTAGKSWLATEIGRQLSEPGQTVTVAGLDGSPPFDLALAEIRVADRDGVWLRIRDVRVTIDGGALLHREVAMPLLRAGEVEVARLPAATESKPSSSEPLRLQTPHLPFRVSLDRLAIDRLTLAEPVLGQPVALALVGDARINADASTAHLSLRRIDQGAGSLSLALVLAGAPARLDLDADVSDPTGLLLDRLLQRSDHPPLAVALHGSGPAADWHGKLTASAGTLLALDADLGLAQADDGWRMLLHGAARQRGLLPAEIAPLVGDRVAFNLAGALAANDVITVDPLHVAAAAADLTAALRLDQASQAIGGTAHLSLPDLAPAAALAGSPLAGRLDLDASFGGTVQRPTVALSLAGTGVRFDTASIDRLSAELRLAATAQDHWDVGGRGELAGLSQAGQTLPTTLAAPVDWTLSAALDAGNNALDLGGLTVNGAGLDLAAAGHLALAGSTGTLRLRASDLAPYGAITGLPALGGSLSLDAALASDAAGRTTLTLEGGSEDLRTGIAATDALLGPRLRIKAAAARGRDGDIDLSALSLTGAAASVEASGTLGAGGAPLA